MSDKLEICQELDANKIQIPYDKYNKVSSLVKSHQNTHTVLSNIKYYICMKMSNNPAKYEVLIK